MTISRDPFEIVMKWWNGKPVQSDTMRDGVDPSTKEGAFECLILCHLYSVNDDKPGVVKATIDALRSAGFTDMQTLANLDENSAHWKSVTDIWRKHYFGGRYPDKIRWMKECAERILGDPKLGGDLRNLYSAHQGDGKEMIIWLCNLPGIKKKTLLMMREMRMRGVWQVDGKYCCVVDEQVGSCLERWHKIQRWPKYNNLRIILEASQLIWNYFGELYDLPILHYSRKFKCNDKRLAHCVQGLPCEIDLCTRKEEGDSRKNSSSCGKSTRYCTQCGKVIPISAKYCPECGKYQLGPDKKGE